MITTLGNWSITCFCIVTISCIYFCLSSFWSIVNIIVIVRNNRIMTVVIENTAIISTTCRRIIILIVVGTVCHSRHIRSSIIRSIERITSSVIVEETSNSISSINILSSNRHWRNTSSSQFIERSVNSVKNIRS